MSQNKVYLAVDLGAGSGRVLAGEFDGHRIELHELNRFDNLALELPSGVHCNVAGLYQDVLDGLRVAADTYGESIISLGIDSWGVDYGLLDKEGRMLGMVYNYRDSRTDGMIDLASEKVSKEEIYNRTGIPSLFFNTVYQLLSEVESGSPAVNTAEDLLFIPDLLGYWLTGNKTQERSISSTSQLYNPNTRSWDYDLIEKLGIPKHLFKDISDPGAVLGALREKVARRTGLANVKVVTVAGHDTASAVAAVPSEASKPAFLSSGTWSLLGLELPEPVISEQSLADGFTNEIGVGNKVRFLKNICGLWLIQQTKRFWNAHGEDVPYSKMASFAVEAEPFRSFINPDDERFIEAGKMPEKIQAYCQETNQPIPETKGQIIRCIYESLALRYAQIWDDLVKYTDETPDTLHIVGGGCQDKLLNQFAASSINVRVTACPVEATGLGNIMVQMLANGDIGSIAEGREIIHNSSLVETFDPEDHDLWVEARAKFESVCS